MQTKQGETYASKRMREIGYNKETETALFDAFPDESAGNKLDHPLFWADDHGNLCIGILDIHGELVPIDTKAQTKSRVHYVPLHVIRFADPKAAGAKYLPFRKGIGVWPYLPKPLIEKYKARQPIDTLIITEGYIKAYVGSKHGLDIIGLPGITVWKDRGKKKMFESISQVIRMCDVREVIFVTDADTMQVSWSEDKDLYKRPNSFYTAVKMFKELCSDLQRDLFFVWFRPPGEFKGLDDFLLGLNEGDRAKLIDEIYANAGERTWTEKRNVSTNSYTSLKKLFFIDSPHSFYREYEDIIGDSPFIFQSGKYQWDDDLGKLLCKKMGEAVRFVQIGSTIYQKGAKPTKHGNLENVLIPIKMDQLEMEFAHRDNPKAYAKKVRYDIDYYHGAMNFPSHKEYQESRETFDGQGNRLRWYNLYRPINWKARPGHCPQSLQMVRHIFGSESETVTYKGKTYTAFELGLDYIKILWERPTQMLPILCLVSEKRQTGKTTFWNWMRLIFQQNVKFVRHEHLTGQFTSYFANAHLVVIDEALIEKRATMERIKALSTAETFTMEGKFRDAQEIESYIKIGISSNNVTHFAQVEQDEIRFWVREVPQIEKVTFNLLEKLQAEIPHFIHYLESREMVTEQESRAHFATELIQTDALKNLKKESRWNIDKEIGYAMQSYISGVEKSVVHLSLKNLQSLVDNIKHSKSDYRNALELRMKKRRSQYSVYYNYLEYNEHTGQVDNKKQKSQFYTFYAADFFKPDDYCHFLLPGEIIAMETAMKDEDRKIYPDFTAEHILSLEPVKKFFEPLAEKRKAEIDKFVQILTNTMPDYGSFAELWKDVENMVIETPF